MALAMQPGVAVRGRRVRPGMVFDNLKRQFIVLRQARDPVLIQSASTSNGMTRIHTLALLTLCLCFVAVRFSLLKSSPNMLVWFDSATFADIAQHPVWSREFWFGFAPPFYPFFMKYFWIPPIEAGPMACCQSIVAGLEVIPKKPLEAMHMDLARFVTGQYSIASIMLAQWLVSVASWLVLACAVFRHLHHPALRYLGLIVVLALGCEVSVVIWDRNVLTESLSISMLVLITAFLVHGIQRFSGRMFAGLLFILLIYVNLRVTHLYFLLMVSLWIMVPLYRSKKTGWLTAMALFLAVILVSNQYILFKADRSITAVRSIVSSRIMSPGYEDIREYFHTQGMPEIPDPIIGKLWYAPYSDYPELDHWINHDAAGLYQKFLVTHPGYFFLKPFRRHNEANESLPDVFVPNLAWQTPEGQAGLQLFFSREFLWLLLLIPVALLVQRRGSKSLVANSEMSALGGFLAVSGFLLALVNWHGDLVELNRHVTPSMLQIRLGLLLLLLGLCDFGANRTRDG
jgi:hypothetical protein